MQHNWRVFHLLLVIDTQQNNNNNNKYNTQTKQIF